MPLPETEATLQVRDLLVANWDTANIDWEFKPAWISTGWANEDSNHPEVTVSDVTEDTTPDAIAPGKGLSAWVDGVLDCNVWVPYDTDDNTYASAGAAKDFRWQLTREAHRIIENHQDGSGTASLTRLETGTIARNPADPPPPYRILLPIGFQYRSTPE